MKAEFADLEKEVNELSKGLVNVVTRCRFANFIVQVQVNAVWQHKREAYDGELAKKEAIEKQVESWMPR